MTQEHAPRGGIRTQGDISADEIRGQVQEYTQRGTQYARRQYQNLEQCVADYPATSVLATFAAGFGVGLLLGLALTEPRRQPKWYEFESAEQVGRRVLDALAGAAPDRLARQLHR